jgi:hypothetical protein
MPWKLAVPSPLERENDTLKTIIVCLRADELDEENEHLCEMVRLSPDPF